MAKRGGWQIIAGFLICATLSGCLTQAPNTPIAPASQAIAAQSLSSSQPQPYKLQVGDVLDIKLPLNPELNDQVTVRPDGMISTAMTRDLPAYGRTPSELQDALETQYKEQLWHPHVSVIVHAIAPTRVYVLGEVNNPGEFSDTGPTLTLLQAVARAGGVKNSAGTDNILIIRRDADDKPQAFAANYMAAVSGNAPTNDVRLLSYDVVYVPRSDIGDAYLYFQQYVQQFVPLSFSGFYQVNPTTTVKNE